MVTTVPSKYREVLAAIVALRSGPQGAPLRAAMREAGEALATFVELQDQELVEFRYAESGRVASKAEVKMSEILDMFRVSLTWKGRRTARSLLIPGA